MKKIVWCFEVFYGFVVGFLEDWGGVYKLRKEKEGSEDEDDE